MKRVLVIFLICILFIFLFINLKNKAAKVPYHIDEISWFFHTRFFDQLFLKRNIDKTFWESYESFDYPPLSKYIFGAYLYAKDKGVFAKRDLLEQKYGRWKFYSKIDETGIEEHFSGYIDRMREVNLVFTFLILVILFLIIYQLKRNWFLSVLFPFLLLNNEVFLNSMIRATSDTHSIFLILLCVVLYLAYLKRGKIELLVLFALFSGAAVASKLTGIIVFIALIIYEIVVLLIDKNKLKEIVIQLSLVLSTGYLVWLSYNPTVFLSPFKNTLYYFTFRIRQSIRLQLNSPNNALTGIIPKTKVVFCTLLNPHCEGNYYLGYLFPFISLNIITLIFGLIYLISKIKRGKDTNQFLFFFIFLLSSLITVWMYLPLNFDRYFTLLVISTYIIQFFGIINLVKIIKGFKLSIP